MAGPRRRTREGENGKGLANDNSQRKTRPDCHQCMSAYLGNRRQHVFFESRLVSLAAFAQARTLSSGAFALFLRWTNHASRGTSYSVVSFSSPLDRVRGCPVLGPRDAETGTLRDYVHTLRRGQGLRPQRMFATKASLLERCSATFSLDKVPPFLPPVSITHPRLPGLASSLRVLPPRQAPSLPFASYRFLSVSALFSTLLLFCSQWRSSTRRETSSSGLV